MKKSPVQHPVSAGGVIYRPAGKELEVVICGRKGQDPKRPWIWSLPKGLVEKRESHKEAARREVAEETGIQVEIRQKIDTISYWFAEGGSRFHKTVHFFLMEPVGGSPDLHDIEFDVVRWVPLEEARRSLSYASEVAVLDKAAILATK